MFRATRTIMLVICVCFAVTVPAACGSAPSTSGTVAQVGSYTITKAMLNQWMTEKVSEDYYDAAGSAAGEKAPLRLVSEPADYPACVATIKTITPAPSAKPKPTPTVAQLTKKCEELYQGIKMQALAYLVSSYGASTSTATTASK